MTAVLIVAIVFGSILTFFILVFGFVLALKRIQADAGGSKHQSKKLNVEETRLIQEIHQGLSKMEGRVEALEILLLDREEKHAEKGDDK